MIIKQACLAKFWCGVNLETEGAPLTGSQLSKNKMYQFITMVYAWRAEISRDQCLL